MFMKVIINLYIYILIYASYYILKYNIYYIFKYMCVCDIYLPLLQKYYIVAITETHFSFFNHCV